MCVGECLTDRERDAFQGHLTSAFVICQRRRQVKAGEERGVDDLTKLPRDELLHNFQIAEHRYGKQNLFCSAQCFSPHFNK